jgi:acetyltransferase-like isoleucine patch superfamily enzyme
MRKIISKYLFNRFLSKFKFVGLNLMVSSYRNSSFSFDTISIGNNVFINSGALFSGEIVIQNNVMFGPGVTIIGGDHLFGIKGKSLRYLIPNGDENMRKITIEDEVWVAANCTINKGVKLGIGCVIGASSLVSKSIPPYTVAVGNPCKPIKNFFTDEELKEHLLILGYNEIFISNVIASRNELLDKSGLSDIEVYVNPFLNENSFY